MLLWALGEEEAGGVTAERNLPCGKSKKRQNGMDRVGVLPKQSSVSAGSDDATSTFSHFQRDAVVVELFPKARDRSRCPHGGVLTAYAWVRRGKRI
jgi:hypothetical protein